MSSLCISARCSVNPVSHILQELTVSSFVPNDTILSGGIGTSQGISSDTQEAVPSAPDSSSAHGRSCADAPSMLILTGPNFSGKSVYLKQVALIVFMAHIGRYVSYLNIEES